MTKASPSVPPQAWCCEKGKALGVPVCLECAYESAGYSAAMADTESLDTSEADAVDPPHPLAAALAAPGERAPVDFLEVPDVQGESGLNEHYSRELVLECIDAALAASPALQAEPVPDINGKPATAHSLLAALVDIYDDGQNAPPEYRCYDENAWREVLTAARNFLATMAAEPVAPAKTRLTIHDYLTKKYKGWPSTMLATEARVFGISYPLSPGWLERHGDTEITEAMAEALRERLGQRGGKSAEAGIAALAHKGKGPQPFGSGPSGISSQAKRSDGVGDVKSTGPAPAPQPELVEGVGTALHAAPTDAPKGWHVVGWVCKGPIAFGMTIFAETPEDAEYLREQGLTCEEVYQPLAAQGKPQGAQS